MMRYLLYISFGALLACNNRKSELAYLPDKDSILSCTTSYPAYADSSVAEQTIAENADGKIDTRDVKPEQLVAFAKSLKGVPYKYASTDPKRGFDCSGFITYVFNHFNINVPRSSVDFTNVGTQINTEQSMPGDLILFTGTDSTNPVVGHMGIITSNAGGELEFIHSSSGKAYGVTTSPLEGYYETRFVKVIRVFPEQ